MASSGPQYFTSPEQEAAGKYTQGQAACNEQDEFNDPQGKYKLVMRGATSKGPHICQIVPRTTLMLFLFSSSVCQYLRMLA